MKRSNFNIQENIEWIKFLSAKTGFANEYTQEITDFYKKDYRHINRLKNKKINAVNAKRILFSEKIIKRDKAYIALLTTVLLKARDTLSEYRKRNIEENIFFDTMKDIQIWSENLKKEKSILGIENIEWIQNHLNCKIFKLGRLQFQPYHLYFPNYVDKTKREKSGLFINQKVINIHIPQGEKLIREDCEKSFVKARDFFKDYPYEAFICESWLLFEDNCRFMKNDSNIIRFAEMFDILGSSEEQKETIERVFGKEETNASFYPENTSLQKSCKAYLLSGGKVGKGFGIIKR